MERGKRLVSREKLYSIKMRERNGRKLRGE